MRRMPRRPWITSIHDGMVVDQYIVSSVQSQTLKRPVVVSTNPGIVIEEVIVTLCMLSGRRNDSYANWSPLKRSTSKSTVKMRDQIASRRLPIESVEDIGNLFYSTHDLDLFLRPAQTRSSASQKSAIRNSFIFVAEVFLGQPHALYFHFSRKPVARNVYLSALVKLVCPGRAGDKPKRRFLNSQY